MCWSVVSIECGLAKFALRVVASPKSCWFKPVTRRDTVVLEKMLTRRASVTTPTTTERGRVRRTSNHVPSKPRPSSARRPTGGPSNSSAPQLPRPGAAWCVVRDGIHERAAASAARAKARAIFGIRREVFCTGRRLTGHSRDVVTLRACLVEVTSTSVARSIPRLKLDRATRRVGPSSWLMR